MRAVSGKRQVTGARTVLTVMRERLAGNGAPLLAKQPFCWPSWRSNLINSASGGEGGWCEIKRGGAGFMPASTSVAHFSRDASFVGEDPGSPSECGLTPLIRPAKANPLINF